MRRISSSLLPAVLALLASLILAAGVTAAETRLSADLTNAGAGDADGTGSASITVDAATGEVCWDLTVENIADVTASHLHEGATGVDGGVVVPLDVDGFSGASDGCVDASDADLDAIVADPAGFYVNIHTEDYPAGAIRGQLALASPDTAMAQPASSSWAALGLVFVALAAFLAMRTARRRA